ncbi:UDP-N-acetylmuramate--L-alanine ligase [bacterium]|nr:UDP-N-acetylmuramate--L-alanine ligase [bacterium]
MNFLDVKRIHFVGIGGVGVSALARLFLSYGVEVSGSDASDFSDRNELEIAGAKIIIGHDAGNVPAHVEAVVYSAAVPKDNHEVVEAKRLQVQVLSYAEALGLVMKEGFYGIAVSGTNGKTTTTAMLGKILEAAGLDPLIIVGGKVPGWDKNLRLPANLTPPPTPPLDRGGGQALENASPPVKGEMSVGQRGSELPPIFLVEGDEYRRHMLSLNPRMIVLTNIEADHLDYYKDLADIESAFTEYIKKLGPEDILVFNADDANSARIREQAMPEVQCLSYGITASADLTARDISYVAGNQHFEMLFQGTKLGVFSLPVPGQFNIYNALAASASALSLRISGEHIRSALSEFTGTWRRFQIMGTISKKIVISDYAHHPTAVRATIRAAKELYPGKKILAVFQPHQRDRTKKLLSEFSRAFEEADTILLTEIYDVAGRDEVLNSISSRDLLSEMKKDPKNPPIGYEKTLPETERRTREILDSFDIILIMGAGDIHAVAENLVALKK